MNTFGIASVTCGEVISSSRNSVVKATHIATGTKLIVKTSPINQFSRREVEILSQLDHPHVAKVYSIEQVMNSYVIVMKMETGPSLVDLIRKGPFSESAARDIFLQLLEVISYLHCAGIAHRDIKLDNVLLDQNNDVVLIDFEFACYYRDPAELEFPFCGTAEYAPPELRFHKPIKDAQKIDSWSLGVVLYILVVGYFPFSTKSLQKKNASFTVPSFVSSECHSLLKKLLEPNPAKRPSPFDLGSDNWLAKGFSPAKALQRLSVAPSPYRDFPKSISLSSSSKSASSMGSTTPNHPENAATMEFQQPEYVSFSDLVQQNQSNGLAISSGSNGSSSTPHNNFPIQSSGYTLPPLGSSPQPSSFYQNALYPSVLPQESFSTVLPPLSSLLSSNPSPPQETKKKHKPLRKMLRSLLS